MVAEPRERKAETHGPTVDEQLRAALELANIPALLMVLVQMTGNLGWLEDPYQPTRPRGLSENDSGGLLPEIQAEIRAAAFDAISAFRRGVPLAIPVPPEELLVRMLGVSMGEPVPADYGPLLAADLGLAPDPVDAAGCQVQVPPGYHVIVIGAGISGIAASVKLAQANIPFTVVEKHATVGGVWLENRYPAVGVDTPSHLYSYSFEPYDWSRFFAPGSEVRQYLEHVAAKYGVLEHVRFDTEVLRAAWEEDTQGWQVEVRRPDGTSETLRANLLVSAVGAFNPPKWPDIPGLGSFCGQKLHTAQWPAEAELAGKRVAIIGTGASAMQVVPVIADEVASLTIFQRSTQWAAPFEKCKVPVPGDLRWLFRTVPIYQRWYRLRLSWMYMDRVHASLQRDPSWKDPDRSVNELNDAHRRFLTHYIESELASRPDLVTKAVPSYPPYGKRMLLDNGWYRALTKPNVELVTDPVGSVDTSGIITAGGERHEADVIILATGFDTSRFLATFELTGRSGQTIREVWGDDDGRAYLGLAIPGFPNFFCLYGPNAQIGHGGSLITIAEYQVHYIMSLIEQILAAGIAVVECRPEVNDDYNRRVDEAHASMVWTHPGMSTYYRNSRGRVVLANPWRIQTFWEMTRDASLDDYHTEQPRVTSSIPR